VTAALNYAGIKALARELGCSYRDLLALAPQHDPFYQGTPTAHRQAEWFAYLWQQAGACCVHLRRMHYWAVSQGDLTRHDGVPYENTEACWKYLGLAALRARYLGLVEMTDIEDRKNPEAQVAAPLRDARQARVTVNVPDLDRPTVWLGPDLDGFEPTQVQPYHLELWIEKSTMNDVLRPVCQRYGATLQTGEGELSLTAVHDLMRRVSCRGRPTRVFYLSDHDPAGACMPVSIARKIEWFCANDPSIPEIKLAHLALTPEQVAEFDLPRVPLKDTEARAGAFQDRHGEGGTELDALEALRPGALRALVEEAFSDYWSAEAERETAEQEAALRLAVTRKVEAVTGRYREQIEALDRMVGELAEVGYGDWSAHEPRRALPGDVTGDDGRPWLFDSSRAYLDQIAAYRQAQGRDER
jgi:hypothetical protein